jgi:acetyltransferase-like isoleucine patch superfamily enzyme
MKATERNQMAIKKTVQIKRIKSSSPESDSMVSAFRRAIKLTVELNKLTFDDTAKVREIFSELIGQKVNETFNLIPPFYTTGGLDIRVGHKVFINQCCTIYDLGGVDIGDLVMIGPNVNIITSGHPMEPAKRHAYVEAKPIIIERNVWIATAATILGWVTVGENSVVGAGAVITKDVPVNSFVAGVPAKVIRSLNCDEFSEINSNRFAEQNF